MQGIAAYAAGVDRLFTEALQCILHALQTAAAAKQPLLTTSSQHSRCVRPQGGLAQLRTVVCCGKVPHTFTQRQLTCRVLCLCCSCFCKLLERLHLLDALWKASNPGPTPGVQQDGAVQQPGCGEIEPAAAPVSSLQDMVVWVLLTGSGRRQHAL